MRIFWGLFLILLLVTGCNKNVAVTGTVTFSDDGSPVPIGTVCFLSESNSTLSRGTLNSNGTYKVGTLSSADGLPPGKYNIYLDGARKLTGTKKVPDVTFGTIDIPIFEELVDPKFCRQETSGLTVEVNRSTKFDFKVDRYKKADHK
jgi:hypothetical protein